MMALMKLVIPILAMALATLAHLMLLGLCVFGMANSTPKQMRQIQLWMLLVAAVAIATIVGGVFLIRSGHPWICAVASLVAAVVTWIVLIEGTKP